MLMVIGMPGKNHKVEIDELQMLSQPDILIKSTLFPSRFLARCKKLFVLGLGSETASSTPML